MKHLKIRGMLGAVLVSASLSFAPTAATAGCKTPYDYEQIKSELVVLISVIEKQIDNYPSRSAIGRFLSHKLRASQILLAKLDRHTSRPQRYFRHNVRGRICNPQVSKW